MKATLEYALPEDDEKFYNATKGGEFKEVLKDVLQSLRDKLKHGILSDEQYHAIEAIQAEVIHLIRVRGLEL